MGAHRPQQLFVPVSETDIITKERINQILNLDAKGRHRMFALMYLTKGSKHLAVDVEARARKSAEYAGLDPAIFFEYMEAVTQGTWDKLEDESSIGERLLFRNEDPVLIHWQSWLTSMIKSQGQSEERELQLQSCQRQIEKLWKVCESWLRLDSVRGDFDKLKLRGKGCTLSPSKQLAFIVSRLEPAVASQSDAASDDNLVALTASQAPFPRSAGENIAVIGKARAQRTPGLVTRTEDGDLVNAALKRSVVVQQLTRENQELRLELQHINECCLVASEATLCHARPPQISANAPVETLRSAMKNIKLATQSLCEDQEKQRVLTMCLLLHSVLTGGSASKHDRIRESAIGGGLFTKEFVKVLKKSEIHISQDDEQPANETSTPWMAYKCLTEKVLSIRDSSNRMVQVQEQARPRLQVDVIKDKDDVSDLSEHILKVVMRRFPHLQRPPTEFGRRKNENKVQIYSRAPTGPRPICDSQTPAIKCIRLEDSEYKLVGLQTSQGGRYSLTLSNVNGSGAAQTPTALSKLMKMGGPDLADKNAAYIFSTFQKALLTKSKDFDFGRDEHGDIITDSKYFPLSVSFKQVVKVDKPGLFTVLCRDDSTRQGVAEGYLKNLGPHVRQAVRMYLKAASDRQT